MFNPCLFYINNHEFDHYSGKIYLLLNKSVFFKSILYFKLDTVSCCKYQKSRKTDILLFSDVPPISTIYDDS